ncbi:MAG: hypothetical protein IJU05_02930, partial [Schwartzia sp.]|nr:hypothetical protein [Schwartzia sp. (in: firmicutes)]
MKTRRLLSLLLALCMALSCLSVGAMADDDEPEEPEEPEWGTAAWCERNGHDWNDEGQCASCGAECPHEEYWGDGHCRNCDYYDESKDVPVTGAALAVGKNTIALPANLAWSRHAFTPAADAGGVYVFSFLCNEYTDVKLYDDDGSLIASGLGWGDAAFGVELTAEKGYTFQVKLGSEKENVSIVVSVQKCTPGAALSVDSINSLATAADGSWALHPFTPEETGYYRFRSQGVFDPQAMKIGFGWSGDNDVDGIYFGNLNFNFRTEEELSAGTTFYLLIRNLDEKAENIPVIVTPVADPYDEAVPSWHYDEDIREPVFDDGYFTYYDFPVYGTPAWCEAREHSWNSETGKCDICGTVCTHEKWWDDGTCRTCRYFDKEHEASPKDGAALHLGKNDLTLPGSRNSINHAFTPAEIGFYRFTSAVAAGGGDDVDPRACLIDGEGEIITSGDDVSPESSEFCFSTMLAAGKTYTIRLENMEKTEAARSVAVTVEKLDPNGALALGDNETVIGGYYTFTPSDNAIYIFRSTGVYDTKGELWSPGAERMDWNDDDESEGEDNLNFRLSVVLEAGKVYTLYLDGDEDDLGKTCGVRVEKKELTEWEALQQLLEGEEQTVTLMKDYVATADDECLLIPEYRTVTLNLNGHTIDGTALKDEDDED